VHPFANVGEPTTSVAVAAVVPQRASTAQSSSDTVELTEVVMSTKQKAKSKSKSKPNAKDGKKKDELDQDQLEQVSGGFVKSWSTSGDADDRPTEEVSFNYTKITVDYSSASKKR
jgi:hypothetical protein